MKNKQKRDFVTGHRVAQGKRSRRMNPVNPLGDLGEPPKGHMMVPSKVNQKNIKKLVRRQNYKSQNFKEEMKEYNLCNTGIRQSLHKI